jgi:hypothetical protein
MIEDVPNLTPVRHIKEGYTGWIDGITKIENLFTGDVDCEWQYRVMTVDNPGRRRIAPPQDLELDPHPVFPPHVLLQEEKDSFFKGETRLHALGYQLSDMSGLERFKILKYVGVAHLGLNEVMRTVLNLIFKQLKGNFDKYTNAVKEWNYDIDSLIKEYTLGHEAVDQSLLHYLHQMKSALEEHGIHGQVRAEDIAKEQQRRDQS